MESNAFGSSHLPSQALVVLSEAASGLHEALRGQRPFPPRLPDAKDLHNMSLVGSYGTHLLHSFHPHLLQTLNHGMLAANGGPASYFASDRGLGKPSVLSNFQLPSAFSPPKYIGISLDQNLFNGNDSFRTDSASPTCTSHESMEGSNDYDNGEKGESPRSNNSDPRDLRHVHNNNGGGSSSSSSSGGGMVGIKASSAASTATSMAAAAAAVAASVASTTSSPASVSHLGHHHHHTHHHHHHPNGGLLAAASLGGMGGLGIPVSCAGLRSVASGLSGLTTAGGVGVGIGSGGSSSGSNSSGGLASVLNLPPGHVPDICPICGIKISAEEWNSHFLTELDRLYKLSSGMERTNLQASYMFAPPCPAQENAIRTSHNRWETFQRIRNNRQNRLRIKGRKRKYGNDLYFMENLFCNSCPICKRKYAIEAGKMPPEEDTKMQEEIETVDVESCNDDVPDSGSELTTHSQLSVNSMSHGHHNNIVNTTLGSNMHSSNSQPGKLDGILYRTACVMNKDTSSNEDDLNATSTSGGSGGNITQTWNQPQHHPASTITAPQGHISVKNVSELSSTTHHFYNADSCGAVDERSSGGAAAGVNCNGKDVAMETCNANDSDEDVIVDDDDSIKMTNLCSSKKRKYDETVVSSRTSDNHSPMVEQERPRSEPQVTSTEPNIELANNNNNNNNNSKYSTFEELRAKQQQQQHQQAEADNAHSLGGGGGGGVSGGNCGANANLMAAAHTQMDLKVGFSSDNKPDDENKCFICKTGIKDFATESFFRGRNLYFHQSCANVMSSYRLSKDLQQQQQNLLQQQQQQQQQQQEVRKSPSPQQLVNL